MGKRLPCPMPAAALWLPPEASFWAASASGSRVTLARTGMVDTAVHTTCRK